MKILALLIGIIFILGIPSFAQNITLTQPGMLPDNPFHGFQDFFENLQLFFAFSPQAKANVHLQLAEKRLAEMNLAIQENKTDLVHSLSQDYGNEINQTQSEVDNAKGLGQNVTALAQHVAEETFKHQLVLSDILNKVPDEAKFAIENAINASSHGHDQSVESILENRNVTGAVNVTFTIGNETFIQTFNITSEHGNPHIESEHNWGGGGAIPISGNITTETTTIASGSCNSDFNCSENMKCQNSTCVDVGCVPEGGVIPGAISPDYRKHMATECCEGLDRIAYPTLYDANCNPSAIVGAPSGVCSNCGNGICESWETKCTCPRDCNATNTNSSVSTTSTVTTTTSSTTATMILSTTTTSQSNQNISTNSS